MKNLVKFNVVLTSFTTKSLVYTEALNQNLFIKNAYLILHSLLFKFYIFSLLHRSQSLSRHLFHKVVVKKGQCSYLHVWCCGAQGKKNLLVDCFHIEEKQKQAVVEKLAEQLKATRISKNYFMFRW